MSPSPSLHKLEESIGYHFDDKQLLQQAVTHRSASGRHNERLEFLGDAILGAVIAKALYEKFSQIDEGKLSRLRSFLVKEKSLADLANEIKLGDYLRLGSGELKSGGYRRDSTLSDALEAIFGAVFLDSDYDTTAHCILGLYQSRLEELSLDKARKDPKTELQEWLQARNYSVPDYKVLRSSGKDHEKIYWVSCQVEYEQLCSEASGASRRKAEQAAARLILEKIG